MALTCPKCEMKVIHLFKCNICGDVRCDSSVSGSSKGGCNSSKSPYRKPEGAAVNRKCHVCKQGKYQKL